MAMDLNAKAAYIRGLMNGMEFDPNSKNGPHHRCDDGPAGSDGRHRDRA